MKTLVLSTAALFVAATAAHAQVGPAPAVGTGSPAGNSVTGTTGAPSVTTPSARGDRSPTGRDALNSAPSSTITGTTTTTVTPPPIAGTPPTPGTSVNGDGSTTTLGTPGTAGTPPGH